MGAMMMFGLVIAISIGSVAYVFHQEKKEAQRSQK